MDSNAEETDPVEPPTSEMPTLSKWDLTCKLCSRKFTILQNLRRHMKNKHFGYRFPCESCSAETTRREDLIKHYSTYHPEKIAEAEAIRQVCKLTPDGKVRPLGRVAFNMRPKPRTRKKLKPQLSHTDFLDGNIVDSQTVKTAVPGETRLPGEKGKSSGTAEPQRVVIALDPSTQFRLERVIAERVHRITEKSLVEILDAHGRVTRRETIEREYHLNKVGK